MLLIVVIAMGSCAGQTEIPDSTKHSSLFKQNIVPLTLILSGAVVSGTQLEKEIQLTMSGSHKTSLDNCLQYVPAATMYVADLAGVKAKNHWFDQTKYMFISGIVSSGITWFFKQTTLKERPNNQDFYSFPSGHTVRAFVTATVLYREFHETSPFIAWSGYAMAAATGGLRMVNNEHWISDVLFGAGMGMLVTNLVYYYEPLKNFNPFKKSENISMIPVISADEWEVSLVYRF